MPDTATKSTVRFKLAGAATVPALPTALGGRVRDPAVGAQDIFFPPHYLQPVASYDVSAATRGAAHTGPAQVSVDVDGLVVFDLSDGSTLVTSAGRLRDTLRLIHPELLENDTVQLEKLRANSAAASRGFGQALTGIVNKIHFLTAGKDDIVDEALGCAESLASYAGTRALMYAIEKRLDRAPGLYRWVGDTGGAGDLQSATFPPLDSATAASPMLVFIHGTGSSTLGSFGHLCTEDPALWTSLKSAFNSRIFGYEHHTLSENPIQNAIDFLKALPQGAHVSLVTHSSGGLVGDLLCLADFDALIGAYEYQFEGVGESNPETAAHVLAELRKSHAEQRGQLKVLASLLRERKPLIQRYVRTASPANGTLLASGNVDLFLSSLLTLIGAVPFLCGTPVYSAFKRGLVEIAKNRTDPHLVPGIEPMLPDSPMARMLRDGTIGQKVKMALVAGDSEGGNMLARLGTLLTDFLLFDKEDNDLVVNTESMFGGIATRAGARVLLSRGDKVTHFRYFSNPETRVGVRDWLASREPDTLPGFGALPSAAEFGEALASVARNRGATRSSRPVVVVLPGIMGSHLSVGDKQVWFDPLSIAAGGLARIAWGQPGVAAQDLFALTYGGICGWLSASHNVVPCPFDWRERLDALGNRLAALLERLMQDVRGQPIRLLAHSMGGLLVRACIHQHPHLMRALMERAGARLIMLGTPNQGAHSMVESLLGKGDSLRKLVRLDLEHDMQQVLDIVGGFRGALQLLPCPGFRDTFQGQPGGGDPYDYQDARTWVRLKQEITDFWFGDNRCCTPEQSTLEEASWLWKQDSVAGGPALPVEYAGKCIYVFGVARATPCGVRRETDATGRRRLRMVATANGDGSVTWESGRIAGIGSYYYMPVKHGDLPATAHYFPALDDLLATGSTSRLDRHPPGGGAVRRAGAVTCDAGPVSYDAGPPEVAAPEVLQLELLGGSPRPAAPKPLRRLAVRVRAMHVRFLAEPVMIGHYDQDPIAGPEALVDREMLDGDLHLRYDLGLYAGQRGTSTVAVNARRQERPTGAVIVGLGQYDGSLGVDELTGAIRAGALRYLLQILDVLGKGEREVPLASLLIGYNSSANLSVAGSIEALVLGVMQANKRFADMTGLNIRIGTLDIVEVYLDTAITAVYALRQLAGRLATQAAAHDTDLAVADELVRGEGARLRLRDDGGAGYWARLIVSDFDNREETCAPSTGDGKAPTVVAPTRLRYLYLGARARAEGIVKQRQPGLVEALVRQQIGNAVWDRDFSRMLFQLMVPYEFKDSARQIDRLVLVVDSKTSNVPWELMLADDPAPGGNDDAASGDPDRLPLALRVAVVRQLTSSRFRRHVVQPSARQALVIGNPSVAGFGAAFTMPDAVRPRPDPAPLSGAMDEAAVVADLLDRLQYKVERVIGRGLGDAPAKRVLAALYRKAWRILHISGHGIFDEPHPDGQNRTGVLLSDGLLITAAEIAAMEVVPELVFLNCCHSGQIDIGSSRNKLAASIARELIDIGVRCVVVAGWAVDDAAASHFGQVFYHALLQDRQPFGEAVFSARRATWEFNREDITWGAFQAYGDPIWRPVPRDDGYAPDTLESERYVCPEEFLDALADLRLGLARRGRARRHAASTAGAAQLRDMLDKRCPPDWGCLPELHAALAETLLELDQPEGARSEYIAMLDCRTAGGKLTAAGIETLAGIDARIGARHAATAIARSDDVALGDAERMIRKAVERLDRLDELVASLGGTETNSSDKCRRGAIKADVLKTLASVHALRLAHMAADDPARTSVREQMESCLEQVLDTYRHVEGDPASDDFAPRRAMDRIALEAVGGRLDGAGREAALALVHACRERAASQAASDGSLAASLVQLSAGLAEALLQVTFMDNKNTGQVCFSELEKAYGAAFEDYVLKPSEAVRLIADLQVLAQLSEVVTVQPESAAAVSRTTAARLRKLVDSLGMEVRETAEQEAGVSQLA